jgi:hypothetical protein
LLLLLPLLLMSVRWQGCSCRCSSDLLLLMMMISGRQQGCCCRCLACHLPQLLVRHIAQLLVHWPAVHCSTSLEHLGAAFGLQMAAKACRYAASSLRM